jgi:hypothetical protein
VFYFVLFCLSFQLCEIAKVSASKYHWRILDDELSDVNEEINTVYQDFQLPFKTEMSYLVEGVSGGTNVYIVALSMEKKDFKSQKLKFLQGVAYAIYVAAFDLDEEETEEDFKLESSHELDHKEHLFSKRNDSILLNTGSQDLVPLGDNFFIESFISSNVSLENGKDFDVNSEDLFRKENDVNLENESTNFIFPIDDVPVAHSIPLDLNINFFTQLKHFADGSNSNVYTAFYGDELVIIKMIKKESEFDEIVVKEFDLEQNILMRLNHKNIIKILGAGAVPRRFIVLEFLTGGSLSSVLQETAVKQHGITQKLFRKPSFTYANLLQKAKEISEAFHYLHCNVFQGSTVLHRGKIKITFVIVLNLSSRFKT